MISRYFGLSLLVLVACMGRVSVAQDVDELAGISLEELMNVDVTSVSKRVENIQKVGASIYVITAADIAQSGATTLHEVLRNVPGYWGVQDEYNHVSSSMRISSALSPLGQPVLFLLDGTPMQDLMAQIFSYQNFDIPLDEIERIEVITGAGGVIYGANSATGVVSIYTKSPSDYDGINAKLVGGSYGYLSPSVRVGGKVSDKLGISGYAKYRHFGGFESLSGRNEDGDILGDGSSRFTEDYESSNYYTGGLKLQYDLNESSKLSSRIHLNARNRTQYTSTVGRNFLLSRTDTLFENRVNTNRVLGNIRYDNQISDNHSLFMRVSTSIENDFVSNLGGFSVSNAFYDLEVQDNFSVLGLSQVSAGFNYRFISFDIHDINNTSIINYVDPQAKERLVGGFVQAENMLFDDALKVTLGLRGENYSLVNKDIYWSPMVKLSYQINDDINLWGGFTQSYTTPGFDNTNADATLYPFPQPEYVRGLSENLFMQNAYNTAIESGLTPEQAQQAASQAVLSPEAQPVIAAIEQGVYGQIPIERDQRVRNGDNVEPTRFRSWELGVKGSILDYVQLNATAFYTQIDDAYGFDYSGADAEIGVPSIHNPDELVDYRVYGNIAKGTNQGVETMVRLLPIKNLFLDLSHVWVKTDWEYTIPGLQEISIATNPMPEHIWRVRANYSHNGFRLNAQVVHTSEYSTSELYSYGAERYLAIGEAALPPIDGVSPEFNTIAKDDSRTILNLRLEKSLLLENQLQLFVFGNDLLNTGGVKNGESLRRVTISQIQAMYGAGLTYRL